VNKREINLEEAKNEKEIKGNRKSHHPWLSSFGALSTSIGVVESSFALSAAADSGG
jgi:hypothetical protein